jgi:hypothetical protein
MPPSTVRLLPPDQVWGKIFSGSWPRSIDKTESILSRFEMKRRADVLPAEPVGKDADPTKERLPALIDWDAAPSRKLLLRRDHLEVRSFHVTIIYPFEEKVKPFRKTVSSPHILEILCLTREGKNH